jgi:Ca2+-binding EF-hand superfamily protein
LVEDAATSRELGRGFRTAVDPTVRKQVTEAYRNANLDKKYGLDREEFYKFMDPILKDEEMYRKMRFAIPNLFRMFDQNLDENIDRREFGAIMNQAMWPNGEGRVEAQKIMGLLREHLAKFAAMHKAFDGVDLDYSETLSRREFRQLTFAAMQELKLTLAVKKMLGGPGWLFRQVDTDGDGQIDGKEFVTSMYDMMNPDGSINDKALRNAVH